ncbi:MarR family winged helix-turn-helix transcriptional regulator [Hespellia stercorisuis]|uniref:Winged helix-turn-helix DNA-binding n=1 Tax=Hespellia stercorisuis DSM 15480 TaxID=1121950 RepID=A0A1M6SH26_9FIRM|nr:winged helix-turn-helix transcriptional regulator [Hespellia stercorisuis]SHK44073.1 Winged helix-turn-helix DNA-binding [Hespellia stercorisuis DSM 15480]
MHYLEAEQYTHLAGEINSLYHEAAVKMGISDSVQNILYIISEKEGQCLQSEISKMTGISRQTINSAIRKLEKEGIVYLKQGNGRNTIVCLSEKGEKFASEKIYPLYEIENKIWNEWTPNERQQYLILTKKYRDGLKKYLKDIL